MPSSRGSSRPRGRARVSCVSCLGRVFFCCFFFFLPLAYLGSLNRVGPLLFCASSPLPFGFKCEFPLCQTLNQHLLGSELKKCWRSFPQFLRAASAFISDVCWVPVPSSLIFLAFFSQSSCLCSCGFKSSSASVPLSVIFSFGFLLALE